VPTTLINPRDLAFLLYEVLDAEALTQRPRFADYSRETFDAVLDVARGIAETHFAPHQKKNDVEEPQFIDGTAVIIPEVKEAFAAVADAGLLAATHDHAIGGMQLPHVIASAVIVHFDAANVGSASYALLTTGAANLIAAFGSAEQKAIFLPPMFAGRFSGTMALTEPEAGSSLADVRTSAVPAGDGTYRITGTKIWISGGDQNMTENIVHMVLARVQGAPDGVKGISLFIVPKRLVNADGSSGALNHVKLGGLIHKMGWRGTASALLNFGESGPCVGYLVGEPNKGLAYMFRMMNEARISVGRSATAMGYAAYLYSLDYARTRRQGRVPGEKDPLKPPVQIIDHADVRRLLLVQKAAAEGALALVLECARLVDEQETAPVEAERLRAGELLEVLTPIAKAWPSDACQDGISAAMQVLGGYGYAREYKVEQLYRDNRLNQIHEGTNGIQALDLLGRKVMLDRGAALTSLVEEMHKSIGAATDCGDGVPALAAQLRDAVGQLAGTTAVLAKAAAGNPALALANATVYLAMASRVVVSWLWLKQAAAASRALPGATGDGERAFYLGKLQAARYFFAFELPQTAPQGELLRRLDSTTLDMRDGWF
jgi:butyryl-CoA dehydrogenase